jgi:hypothetical protein
MRLQDILRLVDTQLGISDPGPPKLDNGTVYLAIGNSKIIGVCVAALLKEAYRVSCSTELYPVR